MTATQGWLDRHWGRIAWAVVGLLVGLSVGWWAGSFTACEQSSACEIRVASIEALGTWVGGLGTVAAVLFAVVAFRSEERVRTTAAARAEAERAERARLTAQEAAHIEVTTQVGSWAGNHITELRVHVKNNSNTTSAFKVQGSAGRLGRLESVHELKAGQLKTTSFRLGPQQGNDSVIVPDEDRDAYLEDLLQSVNVSFEMNSRRWQRRGRDDPHELP